MHPFLDSFEANADRSAERIAVSDQSLTLDYRALRAVACGLAAQIEPLTQRPRVGVLAPTSAACATAIVACWYAGRTPVPLNFLLTPEELGRIIADAGLDLVLTIDRFAPPIKAAGLRALILNGATLAPGAGIAPAASGSDAAAVIYTSGTSGEPKGVVLSFDNVVGNGRAAAEHARIDADQVLLSVLPQFHSFGFTAMTVLPLILGATVHYLPRFTPLTVVNTIAEKRVTIFMAVASMYSALAILKNADPAALASVRLAISGGEPLPLRSADLFAERFGVPIHEGYGLTETSPIVSINLPWSSRRGSVGTPLPGIDVHTVDAHRGPLAKGAEGELVVRGHCVMQGYLNKPAQTAEVVRGGALHTGDIGRVDDQGFIFITGRAKEMIIVGGENIFPREIEAALAEHPAVAEAAVIGVRDPLRGETPLAYVILKEGMSAESTALRDFCRDRLAGYKVPREVRVMPDLPRGPTGKILKRALPRE
ncbi:MAG: AMP-binding protein [Phycisphaerae bacterium]